MACYLLAYAGVTFHVTRTFHASIEGLLLLSSSTTCCEGTYVIGIPLLVKVLPSFILGVLVVIERTTPFKIGINIILNYVVHILMVH